jgi:alkylhydroperoxidase family enzyme
MTTFTTPAGFLADPTVDEQVERMYAADLEGQGYVANLTRVWAHSPETLGVLSYALKLATDLSGLDPVERNLVVTAAASALGDAYCSFAFGSKLARSVGPDITASIVRGDDSRLTQRGRLLTTWARQVAENPNGTISEQVAALREGGFDDRAIFGLTFFVALRVAFSTVNDALGATPDPELLARTPEQLQDAVMFGRRTAPATSTASTAVEAS